MFLEGLREDTPFRGLNGFPSSRARGSGLEMLSLLVRPPYTRLPHSRVLSDTQTRPCAQSLVLPPPQTRPQPRAGTVGRLPGAPPTPAAGCGGAPRLALISSLLKVTVVRASRTWQMDFDFL